MSRNAEMDAIRTARSRQKVLESAFVLFAGRGIESVTIPEIAKAAGMDRSSVYRFFPTKPDLAVAVSTGMWDRFNRQKLEGTDTGEKTAAERYGLWLDSFLELYREHKDLLRYNQFFNVYAANEKISRERMEPFSRVIDALEARFRDLYRQGRRDGTLETGIPEEEMFSATLHLMLAAVTRYAVGLIYESRDPEKELTALKEMLMRKYTKQENG